MTNWDLHEKDVFNHIMAFPGQNSVLSVHRKITNQEGTIVPVVLHKLPLKTAMPHMTNMTSDPLTHTG